MLRLGLSPMPQPLTKTETKTKTIGEPHTHDGRKAAIR